MNKKILILFTLTILMLQAFAQQSKNDYFVVVLKHPHKKHTDTIGIFGIKRGTPVKIYLNDGSKHEGRLIAFTTDSLTVDSFSCTIHAVRMISTFTKTKRIIFYSGLGLSLAGVALAGSTLVTGPFLAIPVLMVADGAIAMRIGAGKRLPIDNNFFLSDRRTIDELKKELSEKRTLPFTKTTAKELREKKIQIEEQAEMRADSIAFSHYRSFPGKKNLPVAVLKKELDSVSVSLLDHNRNNLLRGLRRMDEYKFPWYAGISVFDYISNQATLTIGYRFNRYIGLEVSPGIYYPTSWKVAPEATYVERTPGLSYDRRIMNGWQINAAIKVYPFKHKPNRYISLKGFYRDLYYKNRNVAVQLRGYHDEGYLFAMQNETGYTYGFALLYGWQRTIFRHIGLDYYFGLGAFYRSGKITELSGGDHRSDSYFGIATAYPRTYTQSAWFPSLQGGIRIGYRWSLRR
ncbi:MAG: hypothetical protein WCM76_10410 [Bacteroidota bacterium]